MGFKQFSCAFMGLACCVSFFAKAESEFSFDSAFATVKQDYQNFYQAERGLRALGVFSAGALLAHSDADDEFQTWYQDDIRSSFSNDVSSVAKVFGEKIILMPTALLLSTLQTKDSDSKWGKWGEKMARAYLVGGPVIGATQLLTGASRPRDGIGSDWHSFEDDNGVSGHSFVGAVPFLTLAKMDHLTETQKNIAFAASALTAWSRVNDNDHYLSQAILGWYVAWESVDAVNRTSDSDSWYSFRPYAYGDGVGLAVNFTW